MTPGLLRELQESYKRRMRNGKAAFRSSGRSGRVIRHAPCLREPPSGFLRRCQAGRVRNAREQKDTDQRGDKDSPPPDTSETPPLQGRLRHSLLHFRAREATEAAQRAFTARAFRMKSEVRGPSLMPLPAPGALHRDPLPAAGGIHFLHRDAPKWFVAEDSGGIFVNKGAALAALAI